MLLFRCSVMSNSLQLHGLQHVRLPCPYLSLAVYSNWCPLSLWCHPTVSSSVAPFSCLQPFPSSESFPMSQLFTTDGQNIGASATALPVNVQGWFPLELTSLVSLLSKGLSRSFLFLFFFFFCKISVEGPIHCWVMCMDVEWILINESVQT